MARKLWINLTDSFSITQKIDEPLYHFTACLSMGHVLPLDDFALPTMGGIPVESFTMYDPKMNETALRVPEMSSYSSTEAKDGLTIQQGDLAAHKVIFGKDALPGTYQLAAQSPEFYITQYEDAEGKTIWDPRPMSDFSPDDKINASIKVMVNAKATATYKQWSQPEPLGFDFEIIPVTPLNNVMPNEPVLFDIRFMGKPFTCTMDDMEFLIAASNTYAGEGGGNTQGFFLSAYIIGGQARISFPTAGQWLVTAFSNKLVLPGGDWDAYKEHCQKVFYTTSMSVNVRAL